MREEFDPIKNYIIRGGSNRFVMADTSCRNVAPTDMEYLPYHYLRFRFVEGGLVAIVVLFSAIRLMVFFEEFHSIDESESIDFWDTYHVYDIGNRDLLSDVGPPELREEDDMLLRCVVVRGKCAKNIPQEYR